MSTNLIEVGPLPAGTSVAKVRQVFQPFSTQRIAVHEGKAYVQFVDANQLDGLSMKYDDQHIPQLGNAKITTLPANFVWSFSQNQSYQPKQMKTADFILAQKKQQLAKVESRPKFVVVADCDAHLVEETAQNEIKNKIFGKYKIGRIIKYKRDVYVQFLDENQIQTLQVQFPGLAVKRFGSNANITLTDPNFSYQVVKKEVQKFEAQKRQKKQKQEKQEKERQQKIKREVAQMNQIKQKILDEQKRQSGDQGFNIRPEGYELERKRISESISDRSSLFWAAAVALWGLYVIFV